MVEEVEYFLFIVKEGSGNDLEGVKARFFNITVPFGQSCGSQGASWALAEDLS